MKILLDKRLLYSMDKVKRVFQHVLMIIVRTVDYFEMMLWLLDEKNATF